MAEFQIIPRYLIGDNFIDNLIQQLRLNNIKKIYLILQSIKQDNPYLRQFKELCGKYEIAFHEEIIDFEVLDEQKFNYYQSCLKNGVPEAFVVFGSEIAINTAKFLNFLISKNKKENITLNHFLEILSQSNKYPLKIFCVINDFTLGSENNFAGIIEIKTNDTKKYVFNANSMPSFVYSDVSLFEEIDIKSIKLNVFGMYVRLIEQFSGINNFEWTKNYIIGNLQTIIDVTEQYSSNLKDDDPLNNIIWTNFCINNGISNFLSIGDWKIHAFAYELVYLYKINLNSALLLILIPYLKARIKLDDKFKEIILDLSKRLYGVINIEDLFKKIDELKIKLELANEELEAINTINNDRSKLITAKLKVIKKITNNDFNYNQNELDTLFDLVIENI